ncbi:hypothetical protein BKA69DRAFT_1091294 [Paraphysoderma sedebokerense]|nr:hypothetical protein BKA69DRAFT_1091294 [Paraphysoderma sedebokerense]
MQLGTTGVEMPMVQKDALAYMVLHVLSVLHSGGYAYLDVKPENIVLCLDFSDFLSKSPREIFKALPGLDAQSEGDGDEANLLSETSSAWKFTVQHPLIKFIDTMSVTPFGSTIDDAAVTFAYCPILEDTTVVSPKLDFHPAAMILCQIYLGEDIVPAELLAGVSISQATALKNHAWRDGIKKRWHQRLSCKNERHVGSLGDGIIN